MQTTFNKFHHLWAKTKNYFVKKVSLLLFNIALVVFCAAQQDSTSLPVYARFPTIPKFTIYKAPDSTAFTRDNLKKKPTVFIIFDPECDHCQRETDSIIAHMGEFRKAQIIMITYLAHDAMMKFYSDYNIAKYPTITMGSDPKFFFPTFFQVRNLPAIFIYDKNRKLKKNYEGTVKLEKIIEAL